VYVHGLVQGLVQHNARVAHRDLKPMYTDAAQTQRPYFPIKTTNLSDQNTDAAQIHATARSLLYTPLDADTAYSLLASGIVQSCTCSCTKPAQQLYTDAAPVLSASIGV
jgi:hypothetical protein